MAVQPNAPPNSPNPPPHPELRLSAVRMSLKSRPGQFLSPKMATVGRGVKAAMEEAWATRAGCQGLRGEPGEQDVPESSSQQWLVVGQASTCLIFRAK